MNFGISSRPSKPEIWRARPGPAVTADMTNPWSALEAWYDAYAPALLAFLKLRLGDEALAEDLLHDVFIYTARRAAREPIADPKAYLFSAALNRCHALRRDATARLRGQAGAKASGAFRACAGSDPAEALAAREALDRLEPELRDAFVLHVFAELTFEELGQLMGLAPSAVHKRFARAVALLQRAMDPSNP